MPTPHSSMSFACDVVQQLLKNARELSKETGIKAFCSALEGKLTNVQQNLEDLREETGEAIGEPRLVKLLDNLETLCQVSLSVLQN